MFWSVNAFGAYFEGHTRPREGQGRLIAPARWARPIWERVPRRNSRKNGSTVALPAVFSMGFLLLLLLLGCDFHIFRWMASHLNESSPCDFSASVVGGSRQASVLIPMAVALSRNLISPWLLFLVVTSPEVDWIANDSYLALDTDGYSRLGWWCSNVQSVMVFYCMFMIIGIAITFYI